MLAAVFQVRAGSAVGRKVFSVRWGMGDHGTPVTGNSKIPEVDEFKIDKGEDCKDEKNMLECAFRVVSGRQTVQDIVYDSFCIRNDIIRLNELAIIHNHFFRLFPFLLARSRAVLEQLSLEASQKRPIKS